MREDLHHGLTELPPADAPQIDRVCDAFEAEWRDGRQPRIEDFCKAGPFALLCELVCVDVEYRRARGERPRAADYVTRFPDLDPDWLADLLAAPVGRSPTEVGPTSARRLGRFKLIGQVGKGSCGTVWRAYDTRLDRIVALKVPHESVAASPESLERFRREARSAAKLQHPGIVTVHDVVATEGLPILVQDFVEGTSLRDRLVAGRPDFREAAKLAAQAADALDYAHAAGAVHRDVKPANIMVTPDGRTILVDFGLALQEGGAATLTADGQVVGTPAYMAPEQAAGRSHEVDARTDVYALGVVLYEMLTGRPPFQERRAAVLLRRVIEEEPRPPRWCDDRIPWDLDTVCLKAMAKETRRRYPSAGEFAADLRRFLAGEPVKARPPGRAERAGRWVRRNPAPTALAAVSLVAALSMVWGAAAWSYNARLDKAHRETETAYYFQKLALASREWTDGNAERTVQLLAECPPALRGWEWRYLDLLTRRSLLTIRHDEPPVRAGQVMDVAYSPDGTKIASICNDGWVRLWDGAGHKVGAFRTGEKGSQCLAWHPSGRRIATGDWYNRVAVWDTTSGELLREFASTSRAVYRVAFHPDGRQLAAASGDGPWEVTDRNHQSGEVRVWDIETGRETLRLEGFDQAVTGLTFHPSGQRLATAEGALTTQGSIGRPGRLKVWDLASGRHVHDLLGHDGPLLTVAYNHDGSRLATSGWDRSVVVWDANTGTPVNTLTGHRDWVRGVAFSPDGKYLATAGADATVVVWNATTWRPARTFRGHTQAISGIAFSPDGLRLASGSADRTVKVWDPSADQEARILHGAGPVSALAYSPDGTFLASAGYAPDDAGPRPAIAVWNPADGSVVARGRGHTDRVLGLVFSPDGRQVASGGRDRAVRLWDFPAAGAELRETAVLPDHRGAVKSMSYRPDGRVLAVASIRHDSAYVNFDEVRLWDVTDGREAGRLTGNHPGPLNAVAYSPDGSLLAAASTERVVDLWDVPSGRRTGQLKGHGRLVSCVAFSPDGRLLVSGGQDYIVRVWDVRAGRQTSDSVPVAVLNGHTRGVLTAAFSPDGSRLATAGEDATIKLWDAQTWQEVMRLSGHVEAVTSLAFSPDGRVLASASNDGTVRLWQAEP